MLVRGACASLVEPPTVLDTLVGNKGRVSIVGLELTEHHAGLVSVVVLPALPPDFWYYRHALPYLTSFPIDGHVHLGLLGRMEQGRMELGRMEQGRMQLGRIEQGSCPNLFSLLKSDITDQGADKERKFIFILMNTGDSSAW